MAPLAQFNKAFNNGQSETAAGAIFAAWPLVYAAAFSITMPEISANGVAAALSCALKDQPFIGMLFNSIGITSWWKRSPG